MEEGGEQYSLVGAQTWTQGKKVVPSLQLGQLVSLESGALQQVGYKPLFVWLLLRFLE